MAHTKDEEKKAQLTDYIILGQRAGQDTWTRVAAGIARTSKDAISNVLAGGHNFERYVAVPARSWKPMTVKTETKTVTSILEETLEPEPQSDQQPQSENSDQETLQPQQ